MAVPSSLVLSTRKRVGLFIDEGFCAFRSFVEIGIASPRGHNVPIADCHVRDIVGVNKIRVRTDGTVVNDGSTSTTQALESLY